MSKNRSSSKAFFADDSMQKLTHDDRSPFSTKNIVCDEVQLSDNLASCSGVSEIKVDRGASNNATEGVEMFPVLTAQKMVVDEHVSCNSPCSNEKMGRNKDQIVLGVDAGGDGSLIVTKGGLQVHATLDTSDPLQDTKVSLDRSNSQASADGPLFQGDRDVKQSTDCSSLSDRDEKAYESDGPDQLTEVNRCPPMSSQEAELDNSDLEEQDVKVCDICGDAGREDLLAICNRCTDGAEHTYCMREMLDKVPEGSWLCEECKANEETVKQRLAHSEILDVKERNKQTSSSLAKLRKKDPSSGATRADNDLFARRLQTKRRGSDMVDPAAKRQVLESAVQSPSVSSPGKNSAPFRDNSFKNVDKMNVKLLHQTSIGRSEGVEKPWSPNGSHVKGSFLKSNSFGSSSSKPKVKLIDEVPQKHRQGSDVKDGFSKHVSKAMPLKGSLSRSNTTETKVKMLSPKDSHILESRGLKQPKDRALFDRKNSFKIDHSSVSPVVTDGSKNQVRGDFKRQSSSHLSGVSSSISSASGGPDLRTNVSLKEGCSSTLSQPDGLDNSNDQPKQGAGIGVVNGGSRSSALDTSSVRSLKDGTNEENKLKAAIQAAMQKRLDMCKRKSTETSVSNTHSGSETASSDRPNSMLSGNPIPAKGIHEAEAASPNCTFSSGLEVSDKNVSISKGLPAGSMVSPLARDSAVLSSNIGHVLTKSAIPEHEFSWLGSFEVYRDGNSPEHISGIQAHISTCASHKVIEMVKKFPQKVSLNEVPRSCTWPTQFQDGAAGEDNVAVYFFARDIESYERSYKNLLEKMMKDDLALKGNIDGFELLIFPSKQLIKSSQRWNMLFFIWGVFRGKTGNCQANKSDYKEKHDLYSLNKNKSVTSDFKCPPGKIPSYGSAMENISTAESARGVVRDNVIASVFVSGERSVSLSNGDCDLGIHSPYPISSYKKFGHHDGIDNSRSTCYHPEFIFRVELKKVGISQGLSSASLESGVSSATTSLSLGKGGMARDADMDSLRIAKPQISIYPGGGRNTSGGAEMKSCDPTISQEATFLEGSSEKQTASIMKDNRSQMKTQDPLKDKGCQTQHEVDLNIEEASKDGVNEPGHSKLEDGSGQEEQHKEVNNSRQEADMDCELMHVAGEKSEFEWSKSPIGAVKRGGDASDQLWPHGEDVCKRTMIGQKRSLSEMNAALGGGMERVGKSSSNLFSHSIAASDPSSPSGMRAAADSSSVETERFFFPANLVGWSVAAAAASSPGMDHSSAGFPSLELALGVENKPPSTKAGLYLDSGSEGGEQPPNLEEKRKKEDEEAALSLSLAFPFADKGEQEERGGGQDK